MRDLQEAVAGDAPGATSFELRIRRDAMGDAAILPTVRRFVRELCVRVIHDADVTARIIVAAHELLDNAVRHGDRDASSIRLTIQRVADEAHVVIDTENFVDASHASALQATLAGSDPRAHYARALRSVAFPADGGGARPGLGLGRVHAEAELEVSCRFEEGRAHVRAHGRFPIPRNIVKAR